MRCSQGVSGTYEALSILQRDSEWVAAHLHGVIDSCGHAPQSLRDAIAYSLFAGGKRLRPALVIESWHACDGPDESRAAALSAAAAVELVHTFSLVHDDLPAMDDDDLRRGRPSSHKAYGEAMAILAGDAMLAMAFDTIARDVPAPMAISMIQTLAQATGPQGMVGGQVLDIEARQQKLSLEQMRELHRRKTGALFSAACRLGAIAAGADEAKLQCLVDFGSHLGMAFQIVDDILDVTGTTQQLGKAAQKDSAKGNATFPLLLGVQASRAEAETQLECAIRALGPLRERGANLVQLARFVVQRKS